MLPGRWRRAGLDDLVGVIQERGLDSVAVPALGVGNGGLDWADASRLVHEKLGGLPGVAVELYRPRCLSVTKCDPEVHTLGGSPKTGTAG